MDKREWLIKKRSEYNLTQKQLADIIDVSIYTISNIEQGQRNGSDYVWNRLEDYFKMRDIDQDNVSEKYKININEKITKRGMNSLFYQIEIDNEIGERIMTISYAQNIANMLHDTPIFRYFKDCNGMFINAKQCSEYCIKLEQVIHMLDKISEIY